MIIDTHTHIGKGERLSDTYQIDQSVDLLLAQMAEAEVDKSCIMPVAYADYEPALEEIREAVAAHPDRLIGFARVNLNNEDKALAQLRRCFDEYDFRGVKIHTGLGDGFPTRRFMDMLSDYGRPLLVHTAAQIEYTDAVAHLARSYPKVPIILGHMGGFGVSWPGYVKLCAVEAKQVANLYLDTAFVFLHQWMIELCHFSDSQRALILGENAMRLLGI